MQPLDLSERASGVNDGISWHSSFIPDFIFPSPGGGGGDIPAARIKMKAIRWTAFGASLVPFLLTVFLWTQFKSGQPGFQFQEQYVWYAALHSTFHIGVDGLSLTMVLLTTLLTPLALLASFSITDRIKVYFMLFLFLETGMLGVFMSLDLLIFFVFWEVGLVPMYFLINQWGSEKGEREIWKGVKVQSRNYASLKFIIYTMAGSLGLLLAIQLLGALFNTFDLQSLYTKWASLDPNGVLLHFFKIGRYSFHGQNDRLLGVRNCFCHQGSGLAVPYLAPGCPYRSSDRRIDASGWCTFETWCLWVPAAGPALYPVKSARYAGWLAFLAVMAIVFGAFAAFGQKDFKRLVAYSSVNHMGFVVLGIAAAARAAGTLERYDCIEWCGSANVQPWSVCSRHVFSGWRALRTHTHS